MAKFIDTFIQRPVFASMIILAMVVVGAAAYTGLGVDRLPSIDLPTVTVKTSLAGAAPEEMETAVSEQIEEVVNTVDGIDELRSISGQGNSFVIATFRLDRSVDSAAQDVRDKVSTVLKKLPDDADPPQISKVDNDAQPVITFALSGPLSLRELSEIADKTVKPVLERSKSVGEVNLVGQRVRTVNVWIDADKLAARNLPISAVRDALAKENSEVPGGNVTGSTNEQSLRTLGRFTRAEQFGNIVIARPNGQPIRISDVGHVEDGTEEVRSVARLNGVPSVSLEVQRQSGANTVEVINAVKESAERAQAMLPPGVKLEIIRDQSNYINAALHEINTHLLLGSILACLVVLLFTRSWRSVIIAGVAIPASVISTFAMMWVMHFTLNSVTMLALVLMVGIVIDDAIVVLENIFRFLEEKKMTPMQAARAGTAEIAMAVLATTLSLAVIFVPVSFMSSITGRFLFQFGITAAVAVLVSLVVSFVLTPTLSARMLGKETQDHKGKGSRGGFYRHIDSAYTWMLTWTMKLRWIFAGLALLIIISGIFLFQITPKSFFPEGIDEDEFQVTVQAKQGANFPAMDQVMLSIEADLRAMPEVKTILSTAGGGFIGGVNQGNVYVRIASHDDRYLSAEKLWTNLIHGHPLDAFKGNYTQSDVMEKITKAMQKYKKRDELVIGVRNFPSINLGNGNFDIDFTITGPDLDQLAKYSDALLKKAQAMPSLRNQQNTLMLDNPELRVNIDRERASDLGINAQDIGTALSTMVGGDQQVTLFRDPTTNEDYDVRLRLDPKFRSRQDQLPSLLLNGRSGLVQLQSIASLKNALAPSRIDRTDRVRAAGVRANLAPGAGLADATAQLMAQVNELNLAPGYKVTPRGVGREFERTSREFVFAFALSIIFMYMILASQYESLKDPLVILLSLPLSVPFALISLWAFHMSLNLYSALGLLVLFGVVKKNAILQVDHMNHLRRDQGFKRLDAIIQGNRDRLRPILMTTLTLVAGMLPLWLGTGPGAEERRAVAVVVIGGQTLSLLITLLITPVAYSFVDDVANIITRRKRRKEGEKKPRVVQTEAFSSTETNGSHP